jgi:HAD superfamily hydrolase (TIGR01549 family)
MITTVLMDYDGTLHDWDSVLIQSLEGIMSLGGTEFYDIWTFDIHRGLVHAKYMEKHDDMMFHCKLLFENLNRPFDREIADDICRKFDHAIKRARNDPIYFPDAISALDEMKESGLKLCLSTGTGAESKAEALERVTGTRYFEHIFSEPSIGCFKTEPKYYAIALKRANAKAEDTVSIGDTPLSDIRPAKLAGITTIWLNRREEPIPLAEDQKADHEVVNLLQAVRILGGYICAHTQ